MKKTCKRCVALEWRVWSIRCGLGYPISDKKWFERGIQVSLPNAKTLTQNGAIWRDFEIVGNLLFCNKEYVYYALLKADEFQDIWLDRINGKWIFHTLSMLDKESTALFIIRYREFLQAKVNESYGEWIPIDWSKREEIGEMK